jgi:predicted SprT family Zn-dependent metalloprotease
LLDRRENRAHKGWQKARETVWEEKMKRVSDPKLQRIFADYNGRYFEGRLPQETVIRWSRKVTEKGFLGWFSPWALEICLRPGLRRDEEELRHVLLHEMVHLKLGESARRAGNRLARYLAHDEKGLQRLDHDRAFKREMRRLERQGALKIRVIKWAAEPIKKDQIGKFRVSDIKWHRKVSW